MINGLDYSMGIPDMATMKQGNVAFVCRYVGWSDLAQTKILTPTEAETLSQNGIAIVSNYEWYSSRPQEGSAAAAVDASRALQIHEACGGPATAPIYFSVDYNSPGSDVVDYFKTLAGILGLQHVGAYGSYDCIKYLFDNNLITWGWQTYAWSNGQWDARAHIRQTQNSIQFGGIEVDFDTGMFADIGQWTIGEKNIMTLILNSKGEVCDVTLAYQLTESPPDTGELCGPRTVASLVYAGYPGKGQAGTVEQIDSFTDKMLTDLGFDPTTFQGSSVTDMENFYHYAKLHYWEIANDIGTIKKAIQTGYPVIFTANEQNIVSAKTKQIPYPWAKNNPNFKANHILPATGINPYGDIICADPLNNSFDGEWPAVYLADKLQPSYAAVIQLPWLQTIPSGDPNTWPTGFNAQVSPTPPPPTLTITVARADIEALVATLQKMLGA